MLSRRGTLSLRNDLPITLPRLVPSFTSKGFGYEWPNGKNGAPISETNRVLTALRNIIRDSMLISAYDLHHKLLRPPKRIYDGKELVFIDSGGYELLKSFDSTEPMLFPYEPGEFDQSDYESELRKLPNRSNFVITSFDTSSRGRSVKSQIKSARQLFNQFPSYLRDILIKPPKKNGFLESDHFDESIEELREFDIIGVTEKEIGENLINKLRTIATLRNKLNKRDIFAPIHVWGGLDPITTMLYYFAGADIFDGVSWLRYAFHSGRAVYRDSVYVVDYDRYGIKASKVQVSVGVMNNNINFLQLLTTQLRLFSDKGAKSFSMFEKTLQSPLKKAFNELITVVPEVKEIYNG